MFIAINKFPEILFMCLNSRTPVNNLVLLVTFFFLAEEPGDR